MEPAAELLECYFQLPEKASAFSLLFGRVGTPSQEPGARAEAEPEPERARHEIIRGTIPASTWQGGNAVLSRLSLRLLPGRTTLVLAPRGHGKSSLLRLLCGQLPRSAVTGRVTYRGRTVEQLQDQDGLHLHRILRYIDQAEWHLPTLTVRQALTFACRTQTVPRPGESDEARVQGVLDQLGLAGCADTPIGDALTRGISGGERRRVALAEALLSDASVLCCDEVTTGLDSARAAGVCRSLQDWARQGAAEGRHVIAALLQPTPEVFACFDDVLLLHHGRVVYHGPREGVQALAAKHWGVGLGEGQGALQAGDHDGKGQKEGAGLAGRLVEALVQPEQHLSKTCPPLPGAYPRCCALLEGCWEAYQREVKAEGTGSTGSKESPTAEGKDATAVSEGKDATAVSEGKDATAAEGKDATAVQAVALAPVDPTVYGKAYPRGLMSTLAAVMWREALLLRSSAKALAIRTASAWVIAAVLASGFTNMQLYEAGAKLGLFMFMLAHIATVTFQEIPRIVASKAVFAVQVRAGQYPAVAPALAATLLSIPSALLETVIYTAIIYPSVGLDPSADRYVFFTAVLLLVSLSMASFFRTIAYGATSADSAQLSLSLVVTILELSAGYLLSPSKLKGWIFIYFSFPYGWATRAMAWCEFGAPRYDTEVPVPSGGVQRLGDSLLDLYGVTTSSSWAVGTFIYSACMLSLCLAGSAYYLGSFARITASPPPEEKKKEASGKGKEAEDVGTVSPASMSSTPTPTPSPTGSTEEVAVVHVNPMHGATAVRVPAIAAPTASTMTMTMTSAPGIPSPEPVTLSFHGLTYTVPIAGKWAGGGYQKGYTRTLLRGVCGVARPGSLTALMGGSGAGKTTLLDCIAGRKTTGTITGTLALNGRQASPAELRAASAYCEQADVHDSWQTVREALHSSAMLRLPPGTSTTAIGAVVEGAIQELGLEPYAAHLVGSPTLPANPGIPLAVRKLLTIGVELVACKPVLYLDEPTSGLDAVTASIVVAAMRRIASSGRTVVATIHQPSQAIFEAFDELLLLAPGGYQAYFGPREGIVAHLSSVPAPAGVELPSPQAGENPATWMMRVSCAHPGAAPTEDTTPLSPVAALSPSTPSTATTSSSHVVGEALQAAWEGSEGYRSIGAAVKQLKEGVSTGVMVRYTGRSLPVQVYVLLQRQVRMQARNADYSLGRLGSMLFLAVLLGAIFYRLDTGDLAGTQSLIGLVVTAAGMISVLPAQTYLAVAVEGRAAMEREVASGLYTYAAYCIATTISETLALVALMPPTCAALYYMVGMKAGDGGATYGHFTLATASLAAWLTSMVQLGVMTVTSMEEVQAVLILILMFAQVYSGLYIPGPSISAAWRWWYYINPMAHLVEALLGPQFRCEGPRQDCVRMVVLTGSGLVEVDREDFVRTALGVHFEDRWLNIGVIWAWVAALQLLYVLAAYFVKRVQR